MIGLIRNERDLGPVTIFVLQKRGVSLRKINLSPKICSNLKLELKAKLIYTKLRDPMETKTRNKQ